MKTLTLPDSGSLYINADPARCHVFTSHAHPLQLSAHEYPATFSHGDGIYPANHNSALT